jgi:hypothetical protein
VVLKMLLPAPFIDGAGAEAAKGLVPPVTKLKPADGGWGLKVLPVLLLLPVALPPNEGNEELEKVLLGADGCVGGKLLVARPPKTPLNAPPFWAGCAGCDAP